MPSAFQIIDLLKLDNQDKLFITDFCNILHLIAEDIDMGYSDKILSSLSLVVLDLRKLYLLNQAENLLYEFWENRNKFAEWTEINYPEFMDNDILFRKSWAMRWLSDCLKKRFLD